MLVMYHRTTVYHAITLIVLAIQLKRNGDYLIITSTASQLHQQNYYGSGMQLNCKLLSCYCKQKWYFIGSCSPIQCENNNGDMSGGSKTGLL